MKIISLAFCLMTMTVLASPPKFDDNYYKIENAVVTEIESSEEPALIGDLPANPIDEVITIVDKLIALGKKIWPIIEKNRAVVTTDTASVIKVLPSLNGQAPSVFEMSKWSAPTSKKFRVSLRNGYNAEVIGFDYTLYFQHSGQYQGKGHYLTSVKVMASNVYAEWGFKFDAKSELINIANAGSETDPTASAIIQVSYKAKGLVNEMEGAQGFYVDGNGNFQVL